MAKLTDEQKQTVAQWAADGANLNDIQSRLKETFELVLTYFDTRLLVMELGLKLQDKQKEVVKVPEAPAAAAPEPPDDLESDDADWAPPGEAPPSGGKLTVGLDQIAIPGMMASGTVTFSDGKDARWTLDSSGRLGLSGVGAGYQPPPTDIPFFQRELQRLLQ